MCHGLAGVPVRADPRRLVGPADFAPVLAPAPGTTQVHVKAFRLDPRPVTNSQFLEFVRRQPQWRRDRVPRLFADEGYLSHWSGADALAAQSQADQPVTRVSWFAARAYCAAAGGRLPEWNEWELAAAADETVADARADTAWRARILDWYSRPATDPLPSVGLGPPNVYGIQDLHGLIWEWVEDFGSLMVSSDSRDQGDPDKLEFCGAGSISAQDRENYPVLMRVAFLSSLEGRSTARRLGFRCADSGPGPASVMMQTGGAVQATGGARANGPGQANGEAQASGPTQAGDPTQALVPDARGAPPGSSLYQLAITLESSEGSLVPLASLRGKPLLVTLFYGSCTSVCPMLANQLQTLQKKLSPAARAGTRILMVSLDPAGDSPAHLIEFRQHHHLDPRWIVARTDPDNVRSLASVLGIRYRQLPDGSFNHSTSISLADRDGVVQARISGVKSSDGELVRAADSMFVRSAANRPDRGSVRRR
jgi:cytochrome oxidase Cu insertion factor (SCO1/SenC/PrrC family)